MFRCFAMAGNVFDAPEDLIETLGTQSGEKESDCRCEPKFAQGVLEERLEDAFDFPEAIAVYVGEREERIAGASARMTSNLLDLGRLVAEHRSRFERATARVLPNESHHTILASALSQGLQFLISPESKRGETF